MHPHTVYPLAVPKRYWHRRWIFYKTWKSSHLTLEGAVCCCQTQKLKSLRNYRCVTVRSLELHGNNAEKARLDVSAVGIWSQMERTFVDVRILHPNSPSYRDKTPEQLYRQHEQEKKRDYNNRVLQVEKGSFTPLIFSTSGGMGPECTKYHKRFAELVSSKRKEGYSHVMSHIRTKIRFC